MAATRLLLNSIEFDIPDEKYILLENEVNRINEYVEQVLYVARFGQFFQRLPVQEVSLKATIQPVIRSQAKRVHSEEYSLCD